MEGKVWTIARATSPALRATAMRDFIEIAENEGFLHAMDYNKSRATFRINGKLLEFVGLDKAQKMRSRKRDILHICESNEVDYEMFIQLMIRTKIKIFLDLNPSDSGEENWVKNDIEEIRAVTKKDVGIIVSTYKDNPHLTTNEIDNIEYLKDIDPELWKVFGRGQWGAITGSVFKNYEVVEDIPDSADKRYYGLDFGYYPDPCAMVMIAREGNSLYVKEMVYDLKLTNQALAQRVRKMESLAIVADSAEPKSIDELNREGLSVYAAVKGKDSVYAGIMLLLTFDIKVTKDSVNLIKELRNYKWNDSKHDQPIDAFNHAIDALRYVVYMHYRQNRQIIPRMGYMPTRADF